MEKFYWSLIPIAIILGILSCSDPFSFSPFESKVREEFKYTTQRNLERIKALDTAVNRPFKVAFLSDCHYHYNNLAEALELINQKDDYAFIMVTGDFTDSGLLKEFEIFYQVMSKARIPYLTAIGNHDHLSNGGDIYEQMYGDRNYTFSFHNVKFVVWDNTFWESKQQPDFEWLDRNLDYKSSNEEKGSGYHRVVPVSHIPPFDQQFAETRKQFHEILNKHDVILSVHGHKHTFDFFDMWGYGSKYVTVGSPQHRNYAELYVSPDTVMITKIEY